MKIEIRASGDEGCPACGATPLIATKQGLKLEAEIPHHTMFPWWRPLRRHRRKVLHKDLVELLDGLRAETRKV